MATGGTLLSTWCSETVRLIVRWIYFDVGCIGGYILSVQTDLFCSLSINNLLNVFAIEISQAISDSLFHGKPVQPNMSTQNAPLAGQSSFAFFQHDQFESFLISLPDITFIQRELKGLSSYFAGSDFVHQLDSQCQAVIQVTNLFALSNYPVGFKPTKYHLTSHKLFENYSQCFQGILESQAAGSGPGTALPVPGTKEKAIKNYSSINCIFVKQATTYFCKLEQMFQPATCFTTNNITY